MSSKKFVVVMDKPSSSLDKHDLVEHLELSWANIWKKKKKKILFLFLRFTLAHSSNTFFWDKLFLNCF